MKQHAKNNPVPIRMGTLKAILQQEAFEEDRSLHYVVVKILKDYVAAKAKPKKEKR